LSRIVLEESYSANQSNDEFLQVFIKRLSEFYGGLEPVKREKLVNKKEVDVSEIVHFNNGSQFRIALKRVGKQEVVCAACHEFNYEYLEKMTDEDFSFLCNLAVQRSLELMRIPGADPLDPYEQIEEETLAYLIPKLMIITGQAKEENFGTDKEVE